MFFFDVVFQADISTMETISMNHSHSAIPRTSLGSSLMAETHLQTFLVSCVAFHLEKLHITRCISV